jgi:8-oxo-dGTP pyrophosphatase MutT (NUDIX family)
MRSLPLSPEGAGGPAPFSTDDLVARRGRLIGLGEAVLSLPPSGDHVIDPSVPLATGLRDAAVLIPVVARGTEAGVILTQRTDHLPAHAGQVAFPGGKVDADDADPVATALREAEEEIGLSRFLVTPLGYGDPYITTSGYRVVPVVALVAGDPVLSPNPAEVADVFEVPLSFLMTATNHLAVRREWRGLERRTFEMPYAGRRIWGVTAGIVHALHARLYGAG